MSLHIQDTSAQIHGTIVLKDKYDDNGSSRRWKLIKAYLRNWDAIIRYFEFFLKIYRTLWFAHIKIIASIEVYMMDYKKFWILICDGANWDKRIRDSIMEFYK